MAIKSKNPGTGLWEIASGLPGANLLHLPFAITNLTSDSSSDQIVTALGNSSMFDKIVYAIMNDRQLVAFDGSSTRLEAIAAKVNDDHDSIVLVFCIPQLNTHKLKSITITKTGDTFSSTVTEVASGSASGGGGTTGTPGVADNIVVVNGAGDKFLSNNGQYKSVISSKLTNFSLGTDTSDINSNDSLNDALSKLMLRVKAVEDELSGVSAQVTNLENSVQ